MKPLLELEGKTTPIKTSQQPAKTDELDKKYKMEDISITKAIPKEPKEEEDETVNKTTTVKLIIAGDKITAKPVPIRPKVKQGLIPGEGKGLIEM